MRQDYTKEIPINIWSRGTQIESMLTWHLETEYMNAGMLANQHLETMKYTEKHTLL